MGGLKKPRERSQGSCRPSRDDRQERNTRVRASCSPMKRELGPGFLAGLRAAGSPLDPPNCAAQVHDSPSCFLVHCRKFSRQGRVTEGNRRSTSSSILECSPPPT